MQRLAAEAAQLARRQLRLVPAQIRRGVGGDYAVDLQRAQIRGECRDLVCIEIRRYFDEQRHAFAETAAQLFTRGLHGADDSLQPVPALKLPESLGVRRRDID